MNANAVSERLARHSFSWSTRDTNPGQIGSGLLDISNCGTMSGLSALLTTFSMSIASDSFPLLAFASVSMSCGVLAPAINYKEFTQFSSLLSFVL